MDPLNAYLNATTMVTMSSLDVSVCGLGRAYEKWLRTALIMNKCLKKEMYSSAARSVG